jgi:hypothetical protein
MIVPSSYGWVRMIVALGIIRVTLDGSRQDEPCRRCQRGGLMGWRRPGVDEFGRRGKYCERCERWTPDWVPCRRPGWVKLVDLTSGRDSGNAEGH